jgi:hypothetical protein
MSTALALFQALCDVGNVMEAWRDRFPPASDDWCAATEVLLSVDAMIDTLVLSNGLGGADDAI